MSSAINITLTYSETSEPVKMTPTEFREFARGGEEFFTARIVQEGVRNVVSNMYVSILRAADNTYVCIIDGTGFNGRRRVKRADLWATLMDGYGLWALNA
jgi:hypothetical protein